MWELDHKEGWVPKNWCFWIVLEKTVENPLDYKELKLVNHKGNQPWIFIRRTDAETEAPILWPPDVKSWLIGKDPDAGKDWSKTRREQQRRRWLDGIVNSKRMNLSKLLEMVKDREAKCATVRGVAKNQTGLILNNNSNIWGNAMSGIICHSFNIHLSYLGPASLFFFFFFFLTSHIPLYPSFSAVTMRRE